MMKKIRSRIANLFRRTTLFDRRSPMKKQIPGYRFTAPREYTGPERRGVKKK